LSQIKKETPLVSVCIPTYNAEKTVANTLRSIIDQTYENLEILVVDNASSDNTLSVVNEFKDPRIKIYKNEVNLGGEGNFTRCIELARGEYTAIFHSDDIYTPDMVQKQVESFRTNKNICAVSTMAKYIDEHDQVSGESAIPSELKNKDVYNFEDIFISILENGNFLICPSFMVKTGIYKELSPFNGKDFRTSADLDMWFRILKEGPVLILKEHLMNYRTDQNHFTYHYEHMRTEPRNFFTVMDHHLMLNKQTIEIPDKALDKYQLIKSCDEIVCAINLLIKNEPFEAKKILKYSFHMNGFLAALKILKQPKYILFLTFGSCLLLLINMRLWNSGFSRVLYKLRYELASDLFY